MLGSSVRNEAGAARRAVIAFAAVVALLPVALGACEDWPPGKRGDIVQGGGSTTGAGTCSGTPVSCSGLPTLLCGSTAGCTDEGSCSGSATNPGSSCLTRSPTECNATPGCFWATVCTGTPFGNCSATTQESCLAVTGCSWTPAATGTGGTSTTTCTSYLLNCNTAAACDCGYQCVVRCPTCTGVCGTQCSSDADCNGTTASGLATPYCSYAPGVTQGTSGASGICSDSR
ncbi:MAG TPA: hypothetical protein VHE30_03955 [Polyangiaceae bacterium]|nr:hypothetical protein [Polyangiaceae bacterium]